MERQWIIIYGGVVSGLAFIGPFNSANDAVDHASENRIGSYEIAEMDHPMTTEPENG